ncbi:MAG: porin [Betaproteobacteria bacterium]|nr:porin [Betaproteobacteria bacterium]MCL2885718.1 porin [Betaproteobacteria bacterium]
MHKNPPASLGLVAAFSFLALALPPPAQAQTADAAEIQRLRQDIDALRASYETRLQALERRLQAAEAAGQSAASAPAPVAAASADVSPAAPAPLPAAVGGANAFNPAVSLILSGLYARTSRDPDRYAIGGFALPPDAEIGPGRRGFSLAETELGFTASIDPWFQGAAYIALAPDNSVSVEGAYIQTTGLGHGLTLKAGRFYSSVGYLNAQHAHAWDFVDAPLAYQAMLGRQYTDDGVQLKWLAPTDAFIEIGLELGRGLSFPGNGDSRNGAGMVALSAHTGGDIGDSHSWRAGVSVLDAKASGQTLQGLDAAGDETSGEFSGRTRVWIADAVWKWAPNGNAARTSFTLQGEYLRSRRDGDLMDESGGVAGYRPAQSGWYLQGVYQFMPRWRVGLRAERLRGDDSGPFALAGHHPRKNSLMLDYRPSEFSRLRLQFAQDRSSPAGKDNQVFLQYQMSLGAHGAHSY